MKHGKSGSYENIALERTANQILHHMEDKDSEDSLEATRNRVLGTLQSSYRPIAVMFHYCHYHEKGAHVDKDAANARAIYGSNRCLDVISFAPTSSRKIGAAIIEHTSNSRSYIHCSSAKEDSRLAAVEHLLVITEDLLQRLFDAEGITSSGWLPATPQVMHAEPSHFVSWLTRWFPFRHSMRQHIASRASLEVWQGACLRVEGAAWHRRSESCYNSNRLN